MSLTISGSGLLDKARATDRVPAMGGAATDTKGYNTLAQMFDLTGQGTSVPGVRLNNLTTTQQNALTGAAGNLILNTTTGAPSLYDGAAWQGVLIDKRRAIADAAATVGATDYLIAYASLSAARTVTLPAASTFKAGRTIVLLDESGSASSTNTLTLVPNGSDTINGANANFIAVASARGIAIVESNGSTGWTVPISNSLLLSGGTLTGLVNFSGTGHAGLQLNNLTTTQQNALTGAAGDFIWNTTTGAPGAFDGATWQGVGLLATAQTWTKQNTYAAGTITTSQPFSITQTWNNAGVTFAGFFVNITKTAGAGASVLVDIQRDSVSKFNVDMNGFLTTTGGFSFGGTGSISGSLTTTGSVHAGANSVLDWTSKSAIAAPVDGQIKITTNDGTTATMILYSGAPTAVSGAGPFLTGSASTLNNRLKINLQGTDYWLPCSTTAF